MSETLDAKRKRAKDDEDASPNKRNNSEDEASTDKNTNGCTGTTSSADEEKNIQTPYTIWCEKLKAFMASKPEIKGRMVTRGVSRRKGEDDESDDEMDDEMDDDDDDEEANNSKYTMEELESIRSVMITENRSKMLDQMHDFILEDQADDSIKMFGTSFSYHIHGSFYDIKRRRSNLKSWSQKFDLLFAYTFTIGRWDSWMWDNEGGLNDMVKELARLWKSTLKKSDEDLGIDGEYTRPGVIAFLDQFKKDIESPEGYEPFKFNF